MTPMRDAEKAISLMEHLESLCGWSAFWIGPAIVDGAVGMQWDSPRGDIATVLFCGDLRISVVTIDRNKVADRFHEPINNPERLNRFVAAAKE